MKEKEQEKVERYLQWKREIGRLWQCKNVKFPIIIEGLGTNWQGFQNMDWKIQIENYCSLGQKDCLLGTVSN